MFLAVLLGASLSAQFATEQTIISDSGKNDIYTGDLDGDGLIDIVTTDGGDELITFALNQGNGVFGPESTLGQVDGTATVRVADLDNDGDADIILAASSGAGVRLYLNDGAATFTTQTISADQGGMVRAEPGDLNGDGLLDLVALATSGKIMFAVNEGGGSFGSLETIAFGFPGLKDVAIADVLFDGAPDIIVGGDAGTGVLFFENSIDFDGFGLSQILLSDQDVLALSLADIDGEEGAELVVAHNDDGASASQVSLFAFDAEEEEFVEEPQLLTSGTAIRSIEVADIDGDQDLDILVAQTGDAEITWLVNDCGGLFGDEILVASDDHWPVRAADVDADGVQDVVVGRTPSWYRNEYVSCYGDINASGSTDVNDLLELINVYNTTCTCCAQDLTNDGIIDVNDLLGLISNYNVVCE